MRGAVINVTQWVQDEKILLSRSTIRREQQAGRWPQEYLSYVGPVTNRNKFEDPNKFFRFMHARPEWYRRRFTFQAATNSGEVIRQATIDAFEMIVGKARQYGTDTGAYAASFIVDLDGARLQNISQLTNLDNDSVTRIYNTAPYAGTVEKNALYFSRIGGVIYFAAKKLQRRYPQLGIRFGFNPANRMPGTTSIYQVPTLTIGNRDKIQRKLKVPGKNYRRRRRITRARNA